MKSVLAFLVMMTLSFPAFADQVIWSCAYNGNPDALTVTLIKPQTGEAGIYGTINDPGLAQTLGLQLTPSEGYSSRDYEHDNLNTILGEYVGGFLFNHINGGIDVIPGWTDHVPPDFHVNYAKHVFFAYGQCIYHPVNE